MDDGDKMKVLPWDVDTQKDFIYKDGALSVPNAEIIIPNLAALTHFFYEKKIAIGGSVDRHFGFAAYKDRECQLKKWGGPFIEHCMDQQDGQLKIPETIIPGIVYIENRAYAKTELEIALQAPQFIFEKQSYDVFPAKDNPGGNVNLVIAIKNFIKPDITIIYGVATDYCVQAAAKGFIANGVKTYIVQDAIQAVGEISGVAATKGIVRRILDDLAAIGVIFINTANVLHQF
jgi:nicotinamidase/pyrazinamidase